MAPVRPRQFTARVEVMEFRELLSSMGRGILGIQGKGTDYIVTWTTTAEIYRLNILRGHANRVGDFSGVFDTITTPTSSLVGSGSITVLAPVESQIDYQLTKARTTSGRVTERILDQFRITQGLGGYAGASGKFTIVITHKLNTPDATFTISGRIRL
jgi:hypothetical protein